MPWAEVEFGLSISESAPAILRVSTARSTRPTSSAGRTAGPSLTEHG
jgi:hypothetical protein